MMLKLKGFRSCKNWLKSRKKQKPRKTMKRVRKQTKKRKMKKILSKNQIAEMVAKLTNTSGTKPLKKSQHSSHYQWAQKPT
jgi:hypothetical protein